MLLEKHIATIVRPKSRFDAVFNFRRNWTGYGNYSSRNFSSRQDVDYCLRLCLAFTSPEPQSRKGSPLTIGILANRLNNVLALMDSGQRAWRGSAELEKLRYAWRRIRHRAQSITHLADNDIFEFDPEVARRLKPDIAKPQIETSLQYWEKALAQAQAKVKELKLKLRLCDDRIIWRSRRRPA